MLAMRQVRADTVDWVWGQAEDQIEDALRLGEGEDLPGAELRESIREGERAMIVMVDEDDRIVAGVVMQCLDMAGGRKLWIDLLFGEANRSVLWSDLIADTLDMIGNTMGCHAIQASCRPGLARILERHWGWRRKAVIMQKDLGEVD